LVVLFHLIVVTDIFIFQEKINPPMTMCTVFNAY
jgi:hypothetical protein